MRARFRVTVQTDLLLGDLDCSDEYSEAADHGPRDAILVLHDGIVRVGRVLQKHEATTENRERNDYDTNQHNDISY